MNENHHACRSRKLNINRPLPAWRGKNHHGQSAAADKAHNPVQVACHHASKILQPAID